MPFALMNTETQVFLKDDSGNVLIFPTGQAAGIAASNINARNRDVDESWRVRVMKFEGETSPDSPDWREREKERFRSGFYESLPFSTEFWFRNSPLYNQHFAHVSRQDHTKIAYTQSPEHGENDRQTRIRAGRYLNRYFSDILSPEQIASYAAMVCATEDDIDVKFAMSPDEIERVYRNGPDSCMSHDLEHYISQIHPVRVYGAGDLGVAYLETETSIPARVLVWPDKKRYGRIYGDGGYYQSTLANELESLGYERDLDFRGARLLYVEADTGGVVLPYFDGDMNHGVELEDGYLVISDCPDFESGQTNGTSEEGRQCDECNSAICGNDFVYVDATDSTICDECYSQNFFRCDDCDEIFPNAMHNRIEDSGHDVCDSCARDYTACGECGELHSDENLILIESEESVCSNCYDRYDYFKCEDCDSDFPRHQRNDDSGDVICDDCLCERDENREDEDSEDEESESEKPESNTVTGRYVPRPATPLEHRTYSINGQLFLDDWNPSNPPTQGAKENFETFQGYLEYVRQQCPNQPFGLSQLYMVWRTHASASTQSDTQQSEEESNNES